VNALTLSLLFPAAGALLLAFLSNPRIGSVLNVVISLCGFLATLRLAFGVLSTGPLGGAEFYVDAFNVYLIALTAFVGMTTSIFSQYLYAP